MIDVKLRAALYELAGHCAATIKALSMPVKSFLHAMLISPTPHAPATIPIY